MNEQLRVITKAFDNLSDVFRWAATAGSALLVNAFGSLAWAAYALLIAMVVDVFTGGLKAWLLGSFTSRDLKFGVTYKVFMWTMVGLACLVDYVLANVIGQPFNYVCLVALLWYFLGEVTSILENVAQTGFKYPPVVLSGLRIVREQIDQLTGEKLDGKVPGDPTK